MQIHYVALVVRSDSGGASKLETATGRSKGTVIYLLALACFFIVSLSIGGLLVHGKPLRTRIMRKRKIRPKTAKQMSERPWYGQQRV